MMIIVTLPLPQKIGIMALQLELNMLAQIVKKVLTAIGLGYLSKACWWLKAACCYHAKEYYAPIKACCRPKAAVDKTSWLRKYELKQMSLCVCHRQTIP